MLFVEYIVDTGAHLFEFNWFLVVILTSFVSVNLSIILFQLQSVMSHQGAKQGLMLKYERNL
jgi:hypothetical protein